MKNLISLIILFALSTNVFSQSVKINDCIEKYVKDHNFNGTIVVQNTGKRIFCKNFGVANRSFDVSINIDTKFRVASITKLFTSVIIMQLVDEGKIVLSTNIRSYLPKLNDKKSDSITVYNLLNHTSGIENIEKHGIEYLQNPYSTDQLLTKYYKNKLEFVPGTHFDYNNGDYIILGKIIESVCDKSYEETLRERLLIPLKMNQSGLLTDQKIIKGLANTYSKNKKSGEFQNDIPFYIENFYAAGAMYSTVDDLNKFSDALYNGKLLKPDGMKTLLTASAKLDNYGCGLWVRKYTVEGKTYTVAERPGRIAGANALLSRLLEEDITIITLSNTDATNHEDFHNEIRKSMGIKVW